MSVIIYQDHIEILEEENLLLRKEVQFLKKQLLHKSFQHVGNFDIEEDVES